MSTPLTPEEKRTVVLTRQNAVSSQLDTAIWLWFLEEPVGSIHALTDNALTILDDIGGKVGKESHFYSKEMHKLHGREILKRVSVFLKHGSKDPNAALKFMPHGTEYLMFDAINLYGKIYGLPSLLMWTFSARFVVWHHARGRLLAEEVVKYLPDGVLIEELIPLRRREFLEKVMPLFMKVQGRALPALFAST